MFPITDLSAKIIAFGGRMLGNTEGPKYLNSPESPLFHKRRSVFGLAAARDAIHERQRVILVEGYIDVIALAQAGIGNVVAPLGTALTSDQLRVLKRFTDNFLVLFDGDRAGIGAAARAFTIFAEVGIFAEAAFLPEGHDPDTFVNQAGREAIEEIPKTLDGGDAVRLFDDGKAARIVRKYSKTGGLQRNRGEQHDAEQHPVTKAPAA